MGGEAGVDAGVETAPGGEGNRGDWGERLVVWLAEAPRAVIGDSRNPTGSWYWRESISAREVEAWT